MRPGTLRADGIRPQSRRRVGGVTMADDLTTITGIAERRATILGDELGVVSFADLAAQDVDTIRAALRRHGQGVTREAVALWIAEAARRSTRPDGWTLTALFLVLYEHRAEQHRTVVRHVDTSDDAEWAGFVTDEPATWVGERLEDRSAPAPPTGPTGEGPDDAPAGVVRVAHVYQPPGTRAPTRSTSTATSKDRSTPTSRSRWSSRPSMTAPTPTSQSTSPPSVPRSRSAPIGRRRRRHPVPPRRSP